MADKGTKANNKRWRKIYTPPNLYWLKVYNKVWYMSINKNIDFGFIDNKLI